MPRKHLPGHVIIAIAAGLRVSAQRLHQGVVGLFSEGSEGCSAHQADWCVAQGTAQLHPHHEGGQKIVVACGCFQLEGIKSKLTW